MNEYIKIGNKVLVALSGLNKETKTESGTYVYDKHQFHIHNRFTNINWSKSLIKQLLVYISHADSEGVISVLDEKTVSSLTGFSERTIKHNNKLLQDAGILTWHRLYRSYISVTFSHYMYDVIGLEQNCDETMKSTGFTFLKKETLLDILSNMNVNVIRATLRLFAMSENQFNGKSHQSTLYLFPKDLKNFLPEYVGYRSKIQSIIDHLKKTFPVQIMEGNQIIDEIKKEKQLVTAFSNKIKDGVMYVLNKVDWQSDKKKREEESLRFYVIYKDFLSKQSDKLIKQTSDLIIYRDESESLITSFGSDKLTRAIDVIKDIITRYADTRSLNDEETFLLNYFYESPSKGLRRIAKELH